MSLVTGRLSQHPLENAAGRSGVEQQLGLRVPSCQSTEVDGIASS